MTTRVLSQNVATNTVTIGNISQDVYLNHLSVKYTSNATVGTRQVVVQILDGQSNVLIQFTVGLTQAASLVNRYNFLPGVVRDTTLIGGANGDANVPIPTDLLIPAAGSIKVFDSAGIAAGDSMTITYGTELPK